MLGVDGHGRASPVLLGVNALATADMWKQQAPCGLHAQCMPHAACVIQQKHRHAVKTHMLPAGCTPANTHTHTHTRTHARMRNAGNLS